MIHATLRSFRAQAMSLMYKRLKGALWTDAHDAPKSVERTTSPYDPTAQKSSSSAGEMAIDVTVCEKRGDMGRHGRRCYRSCRRVHVR
ncbi:MAG: hypothetical protein IPF79_02370 [Ignavibacteria bacterium]|nr:hypothetical protein [Ignavibacteria bacterium]